MSTDKNAREIGCDRMRVSPIYINKEDYKRNRMR